MFEESPPLAIAHVQTALLSEAVRHAGVGVLVWDDDRRYVAANARACELLGCTLEQLIGSVVGERTENGATAVQTIVRGRGGSGELAFTRFDGIEARLCFVSFETQIAGLPYMGSVVWPKP